MGQLQENVERAHQSRTLPSKLVLNMKTYICYYGSQRGQIEATDRKDATRKAIHKYNIPQTSDRNPLLLLLSHDEKGEPTIPGWNTSKA